MVSSAAKARVEAPGMGIATSIARCNFAEGHMIGLAHLLFGSVAEYVVRMAEPPVLTVRPEYKGE